MMKKVACVILVDSIIKPKKVYLVKRNPNAELFGGFYVFPGGHQENIDVYCDKNELFTGFVEHSSLCFTALRELFEETGILGCEKINFSEEEQKKMQQDMLEGHTKSFVEGLKLKKWIFNFDQLKFVGYGVPTAYLPLRADVYYFMLEMPHGQTPHVYDKENTEGFFIDIKNVLNKHQKGENSLFYPIFKMLKNMVSSKNSSYHSKNLLFDQKNYTHAGAELIKGVHIVPVKTYTLPPATHTNTYILGDKELVIVDPATPIEEEQYRLLDYIKYLESLGSKVVEIWLTHHHQDHIGAVNFIRKKLNVGVATHKFTMESIKNTIKVDRLIQDNEEYPLFLDDIQKVSWVALHTPGHTRGHLCFFEKDRSLLLSGDNVLGIGTVIINPPEGNMIDYMESLDRMRFLNAHLLFPAHGQYIANPNKKIDFYINHRKKREYTILCSLKEKHLNIRDIVKNVYTDINSNLYPLAEVNVRAHLEKLLAESQVIENKGHFSLVK